MGVYTRKDSPYYWMSGLDIKPQSTRVLVDAPTKWQRQQQRISADTIYAQAVERVARLAHGLPVAPASITFDAYASWYLEHKTAKKKSADSERYVIAQLLECFRGRPLASITPQAVEEYQTTRLTAVRWNTVNRETACLKAMLRAAVPTYLTASPLQGIGRLKGVERQSRALTPAEETRLLTHLSPADRALYLVAVSTLIRLSDLLKLRHSDDHGTYLVVSDSKTGYYEAPISARARAALDSLPRNGPYIFWHRRTGKTPANWRRIIRIALMRACTAARIPTGKAQGGVTWHSATRATGATRMLHRGVDLATVKRVGNWKTLAQLEHYLHPTPTLRAAVDLIDPARSTRVVRRGENSPKLPANRGVAKPPRSGPRSENR